MLICYSTPHGDCFLAQSTSFTPGLAALDIRAVNTLPFPITDLIPDLNTDPANPLDEQYIDQYLNPDSLFPTEYLSKELSPAKTIKDPTEVLRAAIRDQELKGQKITESDVIVISTKPTQPTGILNIPVVTSNANAVQMDAIIWVEKVKDAGAESFLQMQYVQRVILDFAHVHWPHVSVATLKLVDKQAGA